jgi:hypothetical protein
VRINLGPAGTVGIGDASQGVCGGMAFAVRDYFEVRRPVPPDDEPPAPGTPLFNYIADRLIDSFNGPTGVATYALGKCHQVLAYGYHVDDGGVVTLNIYDPNTKRATADDVWIRFDSAHPHIVSTIGHNINIGEPTLHGFFRSAYSPKPPPT